MKIINKQILNKKTTLIWLSNDEINRDDIEREANVIENNIICYYLLQKSADSKDRIRELIINQLEVE